MTRKNILTRALVILSIIALFLQQAQAESYWQKAKNVVADGAKKITELRSGNVEPKHKAKDREELVSKEYTKEIFADKDIEDTPSPGEDSANHRDGQLSEEEINKIWSEHMHDFVPEDMTTVIVEKSTTESLFEQINHQVPTTIKGAYYVLGGTESKTIDCVIYDPSRNIVYKRRGSNQGIFVFETSGPGEYAIVFSNRKSGEDLTVTLALHTYEDKKEEIQWDILDNGKRIEIDPYTQEEISKSSSTDAAAEGTDDMLTDSEVKKVKEKLLEILNGIKQI